MRILRTLVTVVLVGLLLVVALGLWLETANVAATQPHQAGVGWFLATVRNHSIETQSAAIVPPALNDPDLIRTGVHEYDAMCATCHGAPGREPSEVGRGLNPPPPKLGITEVQAYSDAELYWIIKHGIRMTGMPAFGPTHDERTVWSLVAFLRSLPGMSAQQYAAMVEADDHRHADIHAHTH
jgi:mono/diheme cytochrome c family protein